MDTKQKKLGLMALVTTITLSAATYGYTTIKKDVELIVDGKSSQISTFKSNVGQLLEENKVSHDEDDIISLALDKKLEDGDVVEFTTVTKKDVVLISQEKEKKITTTTNNVEEFLKEQKVVYDEDDIVTLELDKELETGDIIEVIEITKKDVTLVVNDKETEITTITNTVDEFLENEKVEYDNNDILSISLDEELETGDVIEITDVEVKSITETEKIDFETKVVKDDTLEKGKTIVQTEGKSGEQEVTYELTYHNGEEVDKEKTDTKVTTEPITKVVKEGTKVVEAPKPVEPSNPSGSTESSGSMNGTKMVFQSTAYCTGTITATGTTPRWGTIAVDPRVIPYGTKVYIPQFDKVFIAEDTGGAIKGNIIDIYMTSQSQAINWGRRNVEIVILD